MTRKTEQTHQVAADWDLYWQGTHENAAHKEGGPQDAVLKQFWVELFQQHLVDKHRLLDLACGNGAVTGFALQAAPQAITACCLDYSVNGVLELQQRYPETLCVAANARHTPFPDASFDIVCSQFGIEYAGIDAINEAARLVAPEGVLAAIMHLHEGAIYRECALNLSAVAAIQDTGILRLARAAFNAGFALNSASGSVKVFKAAEKKLTPAIRALEGILHDMGSNVAAGLAQQLYDDIAHMYRRMSSYDREDVIDWINRMVWELDAYRGRMSSMVNAALDNKNMQQIKMQIAANGLTLKACRTLQMGVKPEAAAWVLVCERI